MKIFVAVLFVALCTAFARGGETPNPADYTIKVHISGSHLETSCVNGLCSNLLYADSILNGKKIQLSGNAVIVKKTLMLIDPGDYMVKLLKDEHNSNGSLFNQEYDLLLPDNIVWHCFTTGVSE
jgi:hypothetical protein